MDKKIKVLIVDDSAVVRKILSEQLAKHKKIDVIGTVPDPFIARDKIVALKPDVITLDVEMPRMDGITFLEKIMAYHPMPVIILSTLTPAGCESALKALELGAVEVIHKPEINISFNLSDMIAQLVDKICAADLAKYRIINRQKVIIKPSKPFSSSMIKTTDKVVAIGASTGGTEAIRYILPSLPANFPGIVIAQHMPAAFTKTFAKALNKICSIEVKEAENNTTIRPGLALIAPGNYHMAVKRSGARYYVVLNQGPMVHHQRPAVDVLFASVAKYVGGNSVGLILTGMGKDGAEGLHHIKNTGAKTIGQDEKSCVVYGMPKSAYEIGAVEKVVSLKNIPEELMKSVI
ncbi:chemotaxis response regulator protein-glutamate methylesterase [bacterium]|nr:chemotaxis response regulator protein-glutamate methylesterase [bacterium]